MTDMAISQRMARLFPNWGKRSEQTRAQLEQQTTQAETARTRYVEARDSSRARRHELVTLQHSAGDQLTFLRHEIPTLSESELPPGISKSFVEILATLRAAVTASPKAAAWQSDLLAETRTAKAERKALIDGPRAEFVAACASLKATRKKAHRERRYEMAIYDIYGKPLRRFTRKLKAVEKRLETAESSLQKRTELETTQANVAKQRKILDALEAKQNETRDPELLGAIGGLLSATRPKLISMVRQLEGLQAAVVGLPIMTDEDLIKIKDARASYQGKLAALRTDVRPRLKTLAKMHIATERAKAKVPAATSQAPDIIPVAVIPVNETPVKAASPAIQIDEPNGVVLHSPFSVFPVLPPINAVKAVDASVKAGNSSPVTAQPNAITDAPAKTITIPGLPLSPPVLDTQAQTFDRVQKILNHSNFKPLNETLGNLSPEQVMATGLALLKRIELYCEIGHGKLVTVRKIEDMQTLAGLQLMPTAPDWRIKDSVLRSDYMAFAGAPGNITFPGVVGERYRKQVAVLADALIKFQNAYSLSSVNASQIKSEIDWPKIKSWVVPTRFPWFRAADAIVTNPKLLWVTPLETKEVIASPEIKIGFATPPTVKAAETAIEVPVAAPKAISGSAPAGFKQDVMDLLAEQDRLAHSETLLFQSLVRLQGLMDKPVPDASQAQKPARGPSVQLANAPALLKQQEERAKKAYSANTARTKEIAEKLTRLSESHPTEYAALAAEYRDALLAETLNTTETD